MSADEDRCEAISADGWRCWQDRGHADDHWSMWPNGKGGGWVAFWPLEVQV